MIVFCSYILGIVLSLVYMFGKFFFVVGLIVIVVKELEIGEFCIEVVFYLMFIIYMGILVFCNFWLDGGIFNSLISNSSEIFLMLSLSFILFYFMVLMKSYFY